MNHLKSYKLFESDIARNILHSDRMVITDEISNTVKDILLDIEDDGFETKVLKNKSCISISFSKKSKFELYTLSDIIHRISKYMNEMGIKYAVNSPSKMIYRSSNGGYVFTIAFETYQGAFKKFGNTTFLTESYEDDIKYAKDAIDDILCNLKDDGFSVDVDFESKFREISSRKGDVIEITVCKPKSVFYYSEIKGYVNQLKSYLNDLYSTKYIKIQMVLNTGKYEREYRSVDYNELSSEDESGLTLNRVEIKLLKR